MNLTITSKTNYVDQHEADLKRILANARAKYPKTLSKYVGNKDEE